MKSNPLIIYSIILIICGALIIFDGIISIILQAYQPFWPWQAGRIGRMILGAIVMIVGVLVWPPALSTGA